MAPVSCLVVTRYDKIAGLQVSSFAMIALLAIAKVNLINFYVLVPCFKMQKKNKAVEVALTSRWSAVVMSSSFVKPDGLRRVWFWTRSVCKKRRTCHVAVHDFGMNVWIMTIETSRKSVSIECRRNRCVMVFAKEFVVKAATILTVETCVTYVSV